MRLPTEQEIATWLAQQRRPDTREDRAAAARALLQDQQPAEQRPAGVVLCQSSAQLADGHIVTVTTFYPAGASRDGQQQEQEQDPAAPER